MKWKREKKSFLAFFSLKFFTIATSLWHRLLTMHGKTKEKEDLVILLASRPRFSSFDSLKLKIRWIKSCNKNSFNRRSSQSIFSHTVSRYFWYEAWNFNNKLINNRLPMFHCLRGLFPVNTYQIPNKKSYLKGNVQFLLRKRSCLQWHNKKNSKTLFRWPPSWTVIILILDRHLGSCIVIILVLVSSSWWQKGIHTVVLSSSELKTTML